MEEFSKLGIKNMKLFLMNQLGATKEQVNSLPDKHALLEFANDLIESEIHKKTARLWITILLAVLVGYVAMMRWKFCIEKLSMLCEKCQINPVKWKLIIFDWKNQLYLSGSILIVSWLLDYVVLGMQWSTLLSWVVPSESPVRAYFIPSLYFPINSNSFISKGHESHTGFSLDVGPMITIAFMKWLIQKLEEYGASKMIDKVKLKQSKKIDRMLSRFFHMHGNDQFEALDHEVSIDHFNSQISPEVPLESNIQCVNTFQTEDEMFWGEDFDENQIHVPKIYKINGQNSVS